MNDLTRAMELVLGAGGLDHDLRAFTIEGEPIAKARARRGKRGFYTPGETDVAEEAIALTARTKTARVFDGNVALAAIFYRSNRHRIDVDNLLKTVLDGLTRSRVVWKDDSQVTALVGIIEFDPQAPRTVVAIAPHTSTLARGEDTKTHTCETCGRRYRPHVPADERSRYCSVACRPRRVQICADCGGPTSAPHVRRCKSCHRKHRELAGAPDG